MPRYFEGSAPPAGILLAENNEWQLYDRPAHGTPTWVSLKLVAKNLQLHKANYWLGWHRAERRFATGRDSAILRAELPGVYEWVKDRLIEHELA